jgi:hypothetical protein
MLPQAAHKLMELLDKTAKSEAAAKFRAQLHQGY